jgi:conjugal transfer/entry exclusion protein
MTHRWLLLVGVLLWWAAHAAAQGLPVYDNANFLQNIVTAVQTTITAIEAVTQTEQGILNLLPLDSIAVAEDLGEMIGLLTEVAAEGQALMGDVASAQEQFAALFGLETVPTTPNGLSMRIGEMRLAIHEAQAYAVRVQTLATTFSSAMRHVTTIIGLLSEIAGNKQAQQAANQLLSLQNQTASVQALQDAAHQRVQIMAEAERRVIVTSYNYIQCMRWSDWPGFPGCGGGQ